MRIKRVYEKNGSWHYVEDLDERNPRTGRPKQKWTQLCRIDAGEAALHQALADFHGQPLERGNMPARIIEFEKAHYPTLKGFGVRKEYERMFKVIAKAFADFDVDEVLPGDIVDFLNDNFANHRTARGHYKARLSTFFSWCVLKNYREVNPCREVKLPKAPKRRGRMTWEAYWQMFDELPEVGQVYLELSYLTPQRPTELRLLRESAVLRDRLHFEPTKTAHSSGEYVDIVLSPRIAKLIERLRALRAGRLRERKVVPLDEQRDPFLMVTEDGTPFSKTGLNSMWRRARDRATKKDKAMPKVTTRNIRPFALAQMEKAGHPVEKIREAAAHTTTGQTEEYLNQHRERFSQIVLPTPRRPKA